MRPLKILVADDDDRSAELIAIYVEAMGHTPVLAFDGYQAVERFRRERPDIVLMDCLMPGLTGVEAAEQIRAIGDGNWVPIIMISGLEDEEDQAQALSQGCDDYLTKPVSPVVLNAKINTFRRMAELRNRLEQYRQHNEAEMEETSELMHRLVRWDELNDPHLRYLIRPAGRVSGDVIAAARSPDGIFYVMLADASGHGLAAAVNLIPLTQVFYAMTGKSLPVAAIVAEMNRHVRAYSPTNRFVAVTLAAIDLHAQRLSVWNGGNPPALLLAQDGEELCRFRSQHVAIGLLDADEFSGITTDYHYMQSANLLLCSDGLLEAANAHGERLGLARVVAAQEGRPRDEIMAAIWASLLDHVGAEPPHDDIALALVDCPVVTGG